jgi:hypothetical protein
VYRPNARFEEAKIYFDGKNKKYAIKKECAIRTKPPYYCLFTQRGYVGSTHDYTILKDTYQSYLRYLIKSQEERRLIPADLGR